MSRNNKIVLDLPDAVCVYYPNFYKKEHATLFFEKLLTEIRWREDSITVFGKTYKQPRLTALYSNTSKTYSYSNIVMNPVPLNETLQGIMDEISTFCEHRFATILANLYRYGKDSNGWHSDDEKELGKNPFIASLSLGQERMFHLTQTMALKNLLRAKIASK